ncbi:glucose and ribitol dehydrogenase [Cryptococcus wingfieldii CBS 7118]|uniref:Glucose and ribitol dehydrogenase n=1 Tax=Cryptococcus wingfieldii CBS 7118 TaxID=1295528 RepID=A0A1E3J682_9TREE|nr:glucose and ribitol dehydrogenase [Cryptococcus wingfieldii CBS 7118]ODN96373.1 glucose and ribitol dehydrogenase [Cryptococcus wingfieldii CBS 7118]
MSPPSSVPKEYRPDYLPPNVTGQMQEGLPGKQRPLDPAPFNDTLADGSKYKPAGKLEGKNTVITGGDSGIGRATAILYAREGANVFIHYHPSEDQDAKDTVKEIQQHDPKVKVEAVAADLRTEQACLELVEKIKKWSNGRLDVLVNNAATQNEVENIEQLESEQWRHVFDVNIHAIFYLTKSLIPIIPWGGSIINNASINPFVGHPKLLDYSSTKGAIVGFSRALSNQIVKERGIRVNCVCPGPVWTPLVIATMGEESLSAFGPTTPIGRAGQPIEVATAFVFLASPDSSYFTAQCFHVNGGSAY